MSLFARPERRALDTLGEVLDRARGGPTWAGASVNDESAMRLGAVWSPVNLLAEIICTMPVHQYTTRNGEAEEIDLAPIVANPSAITDVVSWKRQVVVSWLLRGNAYGIQTGTAKNGWPTRIEVAHPDWIGAYQRRRLGPVDWYLNGKPLDAAEMWHAPAFTVPGVPIGLSPIQYARQTIGLGLGASEFAARFFGDGGHPTVMLKTDRKVDQPEAEIIKQRYIDATRGNREPFVAGLGLDATTIQVTAEESQFLATIAANRRDIAAIFLPHLILSEAGTMTYTNVESRSLDLLVFDVQPWLYRFEKWWSSMLPRPQYVKFNADALVRTTLKERYEAHAVAIETGFENVDEVREVEDKPKLPNGQGQQFLWPPAAAAKKEQPK